MSWGTHLVVLALTGAILLLANLVYATSTRIYRHKHIWGKLDCVGGVNATSSTSSWIAALFRSIGSLQDGAQEGYDRFIKSATRPRPFVLPTMWTGGPVVVLPPSMLPLVNRSPTQETGVLGLLEQFQFRYLHPDPDVWANTAIHFDVVRRDMAHKKMASLAAIIADEWPAAFRACWDDEDSAAAAGVSAWDSGVGIMARVALRLLVGLPGCRDASFFELSQLYARAFIVDGVAINCLPPALRPLLGPVLALRARYYQRKVLRALVPLVEQKLAEAATDKNDDGQQQQQSGDVIKWLIARSATEGPEQMQPAKIARRVVALMSMFGFAIGWVFTHALLDIYSSPSRDDVVAGLEDECVSVSRRHNGVDTKEAVEALFRLDSAVRESMRLSDVSVHILPLDVVAGDGIDLGVDGARITPGCGLRAVFPAQMIHADPDNYSNPNTYDAFRFSRPFEELDVVQQNEEEKKEEKKRELMTTTTATFLPFGYGRRSCPGRWLVAHMVKQALAHVVLNYDVEVTQRPGPRKALLNFMLPAETARITVTRKKKF
ncbi:uncharacterized protein PgNI_07673 [Pyricularia grisea]|uniref:Cytochrome P450 n=1 Tax=Pyricularia grisea TaxID=148305 RepID=A0A6P8B3Z6_PYRGI|nr:uncharacterized protein PgNI_07673 [Pyricularia grisea]TLD09423.1 hypothetical protein PgNI_07673 [Pyricularia grisea]